MDTIITMDSNECPDVTIYTSEHDTAMIQEESQTVNDTNCGGYSSCSFVNEPDSALICPVCTHVLREPELTGCCGNHFCASCLKEWVDVATSGPDGSCPLCREKKFTTFRDKKTERAIFELQVLSQIKLDLLGIKNEKQTIIILASSLFLFIINRL